jgi:putative peptidoglycan binding protein
MKQKKQFLTAALLSASVGLGAQSVLAQTAPGGPAVPSNPRAPGVPQPEPNLPREIQPTIPGQPAPGIPQTDRMPGRPTIPEGAQRQSTGDQNMIVTSDDVRKAQDALRAKGLNPGTDGTMDAKTQQALREFQAANNLPATGVLDDRTVQKLGVRSSSSNRPDSSLPKSDRPPQ